MSALPPKADMRSALVHVCFGPKADIAIELAPAQDQIKHCGKLLPNSQDCRERAMIDRGKELPSYPVAEAAFKAIADWVNTYRNTIGSNNEFGMCGPDEVARMAKDIGVTSSQLQDLVRKGPDSAKLKHLVSEREQRRWRAQRGRDDAISALG